MANEFKHKDPCSTLTQAEYIAACGDGHIFACQATGDIAYASSATVLSKLGKGAAGTILNMGGSCIPAWTATPTIGSTSWCNAGHAHAASNSGGTVCANVLAGTTLKSCVVTSSLTSVGTLGALTVDDVAINGKVVTMTGSACDTIVMTAATNGAFSLVTTDTAAAAANITITADGTVDINSAGLLTLDSGAAINIEPAACSAILLDGTISIDAGVVTGATSITSTVIELGHASDTTIARSGSGAITVEGNQVYLAGGTDVALADGGTGASLSDPGADRILFWDDSAGAVAFLVPNCNLAISGTNLNACGGGGVVSGGTDNAILRANGTGGSTSQGSPATIADTTGTITLAACGQFIAGTGDCDTPGFTFVGDLNTGMFRPACHTVGWTTNGTERMRLDGTELRVGADLGTANTYMGTGISICQAGCDNEIISLKSSDVGHSFTACTQADTYGAFKKAHNCNGGLLVEGWNQAGVFAVVIRANQNSGCDGKIKQASAAIRLDSRKSDGSTSAGPLDSNHNMVVMRCESSTKFLFDKEGDFFAGCGCSLTQITDNYNDTEMIRALDITKSKFGAKGLVDCRWDEFITYNECSLVELGILGCTLENGGLLNVTALQRLHNGAIWQLQTQIRGQAEELTARIDGLETQLKALRGGCP